MPTKKKMKIVSTKKTKTPSKKSSKKKVTSGAAIPLHKKSLQEVASLYSLYRRDGAAGLADALLNTGLIYDELFAELRVALPPGVFAVCHTGHFVYQNSWEKPNDYLPNSHPLIYLLADATVKALPRPLPEWVLCSFCGKPIRVDPVGKPVLLTLTNCPHPTPHRRDSGWIVQTIFV